MNQQDCYLHLNYRPYVNICREWMQMKKQQAVDKWEQYGDDIQFRAVRSGPVYEWCKQFEEDCDIPERDTDWQFVRFGPESSVPIHRDPKSLAWIAVTVKGHQPLEFYNMDKEKQFQIYYDFALVNSKVPHFVDVKGKERILLRKIFTKTTYDTLFQSLNCVLSPLKSI